MDKDLNMTIFEGICCNKQSLYACSDNSGAYTVFRFFSDCKNVFRHVIQEYPVNPDKYVFLYKTTVNGKVRQIVTYRATTDGQLLRNLHRLFVLSLSGIYQFHPNSFAYQKEKNCILCLKKHLTADTFLKTDIHSFFDTVPFDLLHERLLNLKSSYRRRASFLKTILATCFYKDHLPIGFVSSPILSDIFLKDLDEYMSSLKGICYTRYADDFIISSSGPAAREKLEKTLEKLQTEILNHKLALNKKKTYIRQLNMEGDAIHLLGLNIVKTQTKKNRITVSQRYISETSKELGALIQNKQNIEPWEMRRLFTSVMGKVSYIVHASKNSAAKLKKLLWIKTGYNSSLTYKALSRALLENPWTLHAYERRKQIETYIRIKKIKVFPTSGRCWERVIIPEDSPYARNPLRLYLFNICREFEHCNPGRLFINRMSLTVGNESFSFKEPCDTKRFRELIKKICSDSTKVIYTSDYQYDNRNPEGLFKYGEYYYTTRTRFRPLIAQCVIGSCILYSENENQWLLGQDARRQTPSQEQTLETACIPEVLEQTEWEGSMRIDLRWPYRIEEEVSRKIDSSFSQVKELLKPWIKDDGSCSGPRRFTLNTKITTDSQTLMSILASLQDLSSLVKQSNGINDIDAWFVPVGFLETTKETRLNYLSVSTPKGKFSLRKFEG